MDISKCRQCNNKVKIALGSLPGEGYQVGFFSECGECGYTGWLLIDEDEFEVQFNIDKDEMITFELKGKIEKKLL